jgi:hypothetical protein
MKHCTTYSFEGDPHASRHETIITFSVLPLRIDSRRADLGSLPPDADCPFESTAGKDIGGGGGGGAHTAGIAGGGGGGAGAGAPETIQLIVRNK